MLPTVTAPRRFRASTNVRNPAKYEARHSRQTLAEGLEEYYARNPGLSDVASMPPEAQAWFRAHDAVHVVYGCGISLADEAVAKVASVFGTTAGFGALAGYRLPDSRAIYSRIGWRAGIDAALRSVIAVPRTIHRCRAQRRRWPWPIEAHGEWRNVTLSALRDAFGIRVVRE
jgi:hypothetical protein